MNADPPRKERHIDVYKRQAESAYPPPPVGQVITVEDSVYGVLRSNRALRGMQENRNVLEHEADRAKAGFGPRVDVTGRAGGSILSDSSTRSRDLDTQDVYKRQDVLAWTRSRAGHKGVSASSGALLREIYGGKET